MSEEQIPAVNGDEQPTVPAPENPPAAENVNSDVDERGVSYKNVAAEARRKAELLEEKIANLEAKMAAGNPPVANNAYDAKARVTQLANNPDDFIDTKIVTKVQQLRYQDRLNDASNWLRDKDPKNYIANETKVIQIIKEYGITSPDPVMTVQKAWKLIDDLAPKITPKPTIPNREAEIKKQQTSSANKPAPVTKTPIINDIRAKAIASGDDADMRAFFNERFSK